MMRFLKLLYLESLIGGDVQVVLRVLAGMGYRSPQDARDTSLVFAEFVEAACR